MWYSEVMSDKRKKPMGRPLLGDKPLSRVLVVRVTEAELRELKAAACKAGLKTGAFIRAKLFEKRG
jgi:hypothetical protein